MAELQNLRKFCRNCKEALEFTGHDKKFWKNCETIDEVIEKFGEILK